MIALRTNTKAQRTACDWIARQASQCTNGVKLDYGPLHGRHNRTPGFSVIDLGDSEILRG